MLLKVESIRNKSLKRILEHSVYILILLVFIPTFLFFEILVVLPTVAEQWSVAYFIHLICIAFLLVNIVGNMLFGMLVDTSIKGKLLGSDKTNWSFCAACECLRPPRSWHCETCDICILKRDHHCTFFACCVGYFNQRYFINFVLHIFVAMLYAFYYNTRYVASFMPWDSGLLIIKFIFPLLCFMIDFGLNSLYVFLIDINFIVALFTGYLFLFHSDNILKGRTTPEAKHKTNHDKGWKYNVIDVLGSRWYLTWICPFISSPLPGNGIDWEMVDKQE